ncbi:MAG TPA: branched-chain amino acid ABC transporter permease [Nocardioidaceae bacterium]|nr:branched-chain amino acid ABC transporter permease [Nocardioidaceae bacterium]
MNQIAAMTDKLRNRFADAPPWVRWIGVAAVLGFAVYLPLLDIPGLNVIRTDYGGSGSDWPSVLFLVLIYMIVAVGLNIVVGLAGLLDLGYVGFYALGAYSVALFGSPASPVTVWIAEKFGLETGWAVPFALCIPIAIMLTIVSGVILGAPTLRLRGDYLAIVTMGFGEIIRITARNAESVTGGAAGVINVPKPPGPEIDGRDFFNTVDAERWYWLVLAVLLLAIVVARRLEHSRVGRAWMAIREDEEAAVIMGVAAFKFKIWAFAMGAALGGVAGLLYASKYTFVTPQTFVLNLSFLFVAMVVIGGAGNIWGALLGAFLITYLPERFRAFEDWRPFAFGVALVVIMVLRPQGLLPSRKKALEYKARQIEAEGIKA